MRWPGRPVTVRVPATSANLGPGFDALGLALWPHDVVEARIIADGLKVEVSGAGEDAALAGEDHLVVRAMRAAFCALGGQPPGIGLRCVNAIPQGYGLGSSAGAVVAGLLAARALAAAAGRAEARAADPEPGGAAAGGPAPRGRVRGGPAPDRPGLTDTELLRLATRLEGHPDNVAACLSGGLTIAWMSASGAESARLAPVAGLAPVLCVPEIPLATAEARGLLPPAVPHADAAANAARAALLIAGLTGDPGLLMAGTEDFLHQPYRAAAMPATADLVSKLRAEGIPAVMSGAGPSVLALTVTGTHPGPEAVQSVASGTGTAWRVRVANVDRVGATVIHHGQPGHAGHPA
jgi:homoserine kinase